MKGASLVLPLTQFRVSAMNERRFSGSEPFPLFSLDVVSRIRFKRQRGIEFCCEVHVTRSPINGHTFSSFKDLGLSTKKQTLELLQTTRFAAKDVLQKDS